MALVQKYEIASYIYFILYIVEELFGHNEKVHVLLETVKKDAKHSVVEQFGLEERKSWNDIMVKERFFSMHAVSCLEDQISDAENKKIEISAKEFY